MFLTPFNTITGEVEFYVYKLEKFYAKGKVMKDGKKALELLLTNEQPYQFELFAPALLKNVKHGMTTAKIHVAYKPGQSWEMKTNLPKFTGLKIFRIGAGNECKVEMNCKELTMIDSGKRLH